MIGAWHDYCSSKTSEHKHPFFVLSSRDSNWPKESGSSMSSLAFLGESHSAHKPSRVTCRAAKGTRAVMSCRLSPKPFVCIMTVFNVFFDCKPIVFVRSETSMQMPPCKYLHCTKATEFSNVFNVDQWCKSMSCSGNSSKYVTCQVNKSRAIEGVTRCKPASSINFTTRAAKWRKRMLYLAERSSWYISS